MPFFPLAGFVPGGGKFGGASWWVQQDCGSTNITRKCACKMDICVCVQRSMYNTYDICGWISTTCVCACACVQYSDEYIYIYILMWIWQVLSFNHAVRLLDCHTPTPPHSCFCLKDWGPASSSSCCASRINHAATFWDQRDPASVKKVSDW